MVTLYWVCLFLGLYPYTVYPILAALAAAVTDRRVQRGPHAPAVSVVISAYNEADCIEATVRNKLAQHYAGTLEVLVASDGSDDGTDAILERLASEDGRVRWFRQARQGKTAALNRLVADARGEIVVFSDANSMYRPDTVARLVETFADATVGYVTGKMVYVNPDGSMVGDGCSAYMRYENRLREIETRLGSVVGVDGGVDAVRRALYRPMRADQLPDFVLPLAVVEQGARVVYAPEALLEEEALNEGSSEFRMRVRVALRALWALKDNASLLAGRRGWLFAWQLWSHKVLRYLSFAPLAAAVLHGVALVPLGPTYQLLTALTALFFVLAASGSAGLRLPGGRLCFYFVLVNAAGLIAFVRFSRGEKTVTWQRRLG
jgi:cellulose synthase/poly-beta-1,6-N-acetylglucosamine synthase-like glycosyltransferase